MGNFREKILQKRLEETANSNEINDIAVGETIPTEIAVSSKFFGVESAGAFPTTLELRLANGQSKAVLYPLVPDFDPSEGIEIFTPLKKITITGRNLRQLYNYLLAFRVKYIQENIGNDLMEDDALFVKNISIGDI